MKGTETLDRSSSSKFVLMDEAAHHVLCSDSRSILAAEPDRVAVSASSRSSPRWGLAWL